RLNPDGSPDPTFGHSGLATADFGGSEDDADFVAVQPGTGQILAAGTSGGGSVYAAVATFQPDGTLVSQNQALYGTGLPGGAAGPRPRPPRPSRPRPRPRPRRPSRPAPPPAATSWATCGPR